MKREKEIPGDLLKWLESKKQKNVSEKVLNKLTLFCSFPVKAVKMKVLSGTDEEEVFRTVIIPPVDVYTSDSAVLKQGFFKRDALSYFISGTRRVFPYGHVYIDSGYICLGNIFVPSAVSERSAATPLETLFLHNDRNLNHGNSHLSIGQSQAENIGKIIEKTGVLLSELGQAVIDYPGDDIIANDQIWILSADVAEQKSLPEALNIMSQIFDVIFMTEKEKEKDE